MLQKGLLQKDFCCAQKK